MSNCSFSGEWAPLNTSKATFFHIYAELLTVSSFPVACSTLDLTSFVYAVIVELPEC